MEATALRLDILFPSIMKMRVPQKSYSNRGLQALFWALLGKANSKRNAAEGVNMITSIPASLDFNESGCKQFLGLEFVLWMTQSVVIKLVKMVSVEVQNAAKSHQSTRLIFETWIYLAIYPVSRSSRNGSDEVAGIDVFDICILEVALDLIPQPDSGILQNGVPTCITLYVSSSQYILYHKQPYMNIKQWIYQITIRFLTNAHKFVLSKSLLVNSICTLSAKFWLVLCCLQVSPMSRQDFPKFWKNQHLKNRSPAGYQPST